MNVEVQENGIIRNDKGRIIARTIDDVEFKGEHIYPSTPLKEILFKFKRKYSLHRGMQILEADIDEFISELKEQSINQPVLGETDEGSEI